MRFLWKYSNPKSLVQHRVSTYMILTWLLPERGSGPPWKDGAAEGSGVPFSHWPVGKEEGKMGEISPLAPTQCAHHPKEKKRRREKKSKFTQLHDLVYYGAFFKKKNTRHCYLFFVFFYMIVKKTVVRPVALLWSNLIISSVIRAACCCGTLMTRRCYLVVTETWQNLELGQQPTTNTSSRKTTTVPPHWLCLRSTVEQHFVQLLHWHPFKLKMSWWFQCHVTHDRRTLIPLRGANASWPGLSAMTSPSTSRLTGRLTNW